MIDWDQAVSAWLRAQAEKAEAARWAEVVAIAERRGRLLREEHEARQSREMFTVRRPARTA